jgi:hypothetical protein
VRRLLDLNIPKTSTVRLSLKDILIDWLFHDTSSYWWKV